VNWTQRILEFPVRAAAVDDFLRDLRARGTADLNAVLTTLNEGGLCRQAVRYWTRSGWIVVAPSTKLLALAGPAFDRSLTLSDFCGEIEVLEEPAAEAPDTATEEGSERHADS